jgi:hypothetical protein
MRSLWNDANPKKVLQGSRMCFKACLEGLEWLRDLRKAALTERDCAVSLSTEQVRVKYKIWTCIRKVPYGNFGHDTIILTEVFEDFLNP